MNKLKIAIVCSVLITSSCALGPDSPKGFSLPEGNAENGKAAFIALNCLACHAISGLERGNIEQENDPLITLGGEVHNIVTYADLVTSIINPSHRLARGYKPMDIQTNKASNMKSYNDVMTVTQLIDLVAYLQPQYTLREYEHTNYGVYP